MKISIFAALIFCLSCLMADRANAQCNTVTCNTQLFVSYNTDGMALLRPDFLTSGDHSDCILKVALFDNLNASLLIDYADSLWVDCSYMGDQAFRVRDSISGNLCFGTVSLDDPAMNCLSSIDETLSKSDLVIDSDLNVRLLGSNENINYVVYNMKGEKLLSEMGSNAQFKLPRASFDSIGFYVIRIQWNNQSISKKFFVL